MPLFSCLACGLVKREGRLEIWMHGEEGDARSSKGSFYKGECGNMSSDIVFEAVG